MKASRCRIQVLGFFACGLFVCDVPWVIANSGGPNPGYTGAPNELTCSTVGCHTPTVSRAGSVSLSGLPATYAPGTTYGLTLTVNDTGSRFGFQLTAIQSSGSQAGSFQTNAVTRLVTTNILGNPRQYIEQRDFAATSAKAWAFNWTAPSPAAGTVTFYMSGLRANNDGNITSDTLFNASVARTPSLPPSITTQPTNQTVLRGSNATFVVAATGTGTLSYQWRTNTINILSATNTSYTVTNAQPSNATNFTAVVANAFGSVTSAVATLTVNLPPSITTQPTNQTVLRGSDATFVVGATGTGTLRYQWRTHAVNIVGATNAGYTVTNAQPSNPTNFTAVVTNAFGSVTSAVTTLTVNFSPSISAQPQSQTVASGGNASLVVVAAGTPSPTYQWRSNGINFAGRTNATLTVTNFQSANEADYNVVAANSVGLVTSSIAKLYLNSPVRFTNLLLQGDTFSALLLGVANTNYVIDAATNFSGWTPVVTNTATNGLIDLRETNVLTRGRRLFRARAL